MYIYIHIYTHIYIYIHIYIQYILDKNIYLENIIRLDVLYIYIYTQDLQLTYSNHTMPLSSSSEAPFPE